MTTLTLTEGLARIKLIDNKLRSKREKVGAAVVRYKEQEDPYESAGGAARYDS